MAASDGTCTSVAVGSRAKKSVTFSRRGFLRAAAGSLAIASPVLVPSSAWGANNRIVVGIIGVNNRGKDFVRLLTTGILDEAVIAAIAEANHNAMRIQSRIVQKTTHNKCDTYGDFRRLLDRDDIDGVIICTPDHWHALMTVFACEANKDVYCEKPLSLTIAEGRVMVRAVRKYGRVYQTGTQQRCDARFRLATELARCGALGELERVQVGISGNPSQTAPLPPRDPPEWLDFSSWLGPAPEREYSPPLVHRPQRFWRWYWDFSGGQMTNWGVHMIDIAQWALDAQGSGPVEITGDGTWDSDSIFPVPVRFRARFKYKNGVTLDAGRGCPRGVTLHGTEGKINVTRSHIKTDPPEILDREVAPSERLYEPLKPLPHDDRYSGTAAHVQDWLNCIRSRKCPVSDVEVGHRSTTVCHLGNIAIRVGRKLSWDPETETIAGDEEACDMLSRPYRSPWTLRELEE